jgi:hypothetical protein
VIDAPSANGLHSIVALIRNRLSSCIHNDLLFTSRAHSPMDASREIGEGPSSRLSAYGTNCRDENKIKRGVVRIDISILAQQVPYDSSYLLGLGWS